MLAVGADESGRRVLGEVDIVWSTASPVLSIVGQGRRPALLASADARPGSRFSLVAEGRQGEHRARGEAAVVIIEAEEPSTGLGFGIPEPELVDDAGATWRSRFDGRRWQVNASHDDYVALHGDAKARLRYLLALLAKEIAQRTHGVPGSEAALESLVEDPGPRRTEPARRMSVCAGEISVAVADFTEETGVVRRVEGVARRSQRAIIAIYETVLHTGIARIVAEVSGRALAVEARRTR